MFIIFYIGNIGEVMWLSNIMVHMKNISTKAFLILH